MRGGFWVLEGMDGTGKTTQARCLVEYLQAQGRHPLHVREPGTTALGERLRALLLAPEREEWHPKSEALLFFAARQALLSEQIQPALAAGRDVVCERFSPSTLAYQGQQKTLRQWILDLDALVVPASLQPDAVLIFDLEPEQSFQRLGQAEHLDGFEQRGIGFQQQVRAGYLAYAEAYPHNTVVLPVDGKDVEEVATAVRQVVEERRP